MLNILDIQERTCYLIHGGDGAEEPKSKICPSGKDISQTELAKRVGVTRQTIGMIEAGDYNPTLKLCVAICRELDKTLNDLFWEEEVDDEEKTR